MSARQEPIDRRPGRLPRITKAADIVTFELEILVRPAGKRLVIRCARDGEITVHVPPPAHVGTP